MAVHARSKRKSRRKSSRLGLWITLVAGGIIVLVILLSLGVLPTPWAKHQASAGPPAPDFSVPTLDGGTFTLSAQQGKPVIIFAMAYWCGTCVPEARALARLHQEYGDRLVILALDVDLSSTPDRLTQFRSYVGNPTYVWAFDKRGQVTQAYRIRSLDTTIMVDAQGRIVYRDEYPTPYDTLKEAIQRYLIPGT